MGPSRTPSSCRVALEPELHVHYQQHHSSRRHNPYHCPRNKRLTAGQDQAFVLVFPGSLLTGRTKNQVCANGSMQLHSTCPTSAVIQVCTAEQDPSWETAPRTVHLAGDRSIQLLNACLLIVCKAQRLDYKALSLSTQYDKITPENLKGALFFTMAFFLSDI